MSWIEPLKMETWIINVLSGNPEIFYAIALISISAMAGYFRMNNFMLLFIIGIFLFMFSAWSSPLIILFSILGGLGIGYSMSKILR